MQNEERINGLETQVRTLKRIVYGFGCLLVAGIVVGATSLQSVPDVLDAKMFRVVNDEGKVIVELSNLIGGGVDNGMLVTRNSEGQTLVELSAGPGGGMVTTQNGKGQELVRLGASPGGGIVITENGKGQTLVRLGCYTGLNGGYVETFTSTGVSTSEIPR